KQHLLRNHGVELPLAPSDILHTLNSAMRIAQDPVFGALRHPSTYERLMDAMSYGGSPKTDILIATSTILNAEGIRQPLIGEWADSFVTFSRAVAENLEVCRV